MPAVIKKPDAAEKLTILSADAQYDLSCACASSKDEHRKRKSPEKWIYPVTLPNGGTSPILKTLLSNHCSNDCKYCPLRNDSDVKRCSLSAEETVEVFLDYLSRKKVFGLFLTSAQISTADNTMQKLIDVAETLRTKHRFRGYIHLKIIPGASAAAIEKAVSLASAVSVNIETPGADNLAKLSNKKKYITDIIEPIKQISSLTGKGQRYAKVKQTTQFIVGAAGETDREIVRYTAALYDRLNMNRVYFSAYQKGLGDRSLPGEQMPDSNSSNILTREHRLYQVDFLLRKYGFAGDEMVFDNSGQLCIDDDPKSVWAKVHPERFPVNINSADKNSLLRVPGLGPITVSKILKRRKLGKIHNITDFTKPNRLTRKALEYIYF